MKRTIFGRLVAAVAAAGSAAPAAVRGAGLTTAAGSPIAAGPATLTARTAPAVIDATAPGLLPKSAGFDRRRNRFVVSSIRTGTLPTVDLDGSARSLVTDPLLVSAAGLRVHSGRGRVLVTNLGIAERTSLETVFRLSGDASYRLDTGATQWTSTSRPSPTTGRELHFVNEIAIAPTGTAYVTDAGAPIIYRIDVHVHAEVLVRNQRLAGTVTLPGPVPKYGQSAVAWVGEATLGVSKLDGSLWQVPVDKPAALTGQLVTFMDAMRVRSDGSIAVVHNGFAQPTGAVQVVRSSDHWRTAIVSAACDLGQLLPTGITAGPGDSTYVLSGKPGEFIGGQSSDTFTLVRVG